MTNDAPQDVLDRIKKLLNLAAKNPNEHEAASAMAKAQGLMEQWNLSEATVERASGGSGKRQEELVEGGFFRYQRELWEAIAELNFCVYWSQEFRREGGVDRQGRRALYGRRHKLIGRVVNVQTTIAMAKYLEGTIERLSKERFPGQKVDNYTMSWRQGMSYRLCEKLEERRQKNLTDEIKRQRAAAEAAKRDGVSVSTALTLGTLAEQEEAANHDFQYGEGAWAKRKVWLAEHAEKLKRKQDEYTAWAKENPEKAAEEEKKRLKAQRHASAGYRDDRYKNINHGAFWAGADEAKKIGLDPQAGGTTVKGRLK